MENYTAFYQKVESSLLRISIFDLDSFYSSVTGLYSYRCSGGFLSISVFLVPVVNSCFQTPAGLSLFPQYQDIFEFSFCLMFSFFFFLSGIYIVWFSSLALHSSWPPCCRQEHLSVLNDNKFYFSSEKSSIYFDQKINMPL